LFLVSLGLVFSPSLVGRAGAHVSLAVNGSVSLNIRRSNIAVEYQIECGARTLVDVRRKIDRNADGTISKEELEAFNKAAQRKLAKTKTPCQILVDSRPVKLLGEKVAFILPAKAPAGTVFLKLWLASKQSLSPGPHKLVLTGDICPVDVEFLPVPAASPEHRHGTLVRVLRVTATGEPSVQLSKVSSGFIANRSGRICRCSYYADASDSKSTCKDNGDIDI
jgi:hypothetical protein